MNKQLFGKERQGNPTGGGIKATTTERKERMRRTAADRKVQTVQGGNRRFGGVVSYLIESRKQSDYTKRPS